MFIVRIYQICALCETKNRFFLATSSKISILGDMLIHKSYINVAIANILNGQTNFYDSLRLNYQKSSKFVHRMKPKPFFLAVSSKISVLGDMVLHKSEINVAIANILVYRNSLYDLPGPKCKNLGNRQTLKKGVAQNALIAMKAK